MSGFQLTNAQLSDYHRDGFVIVENFLNGDELELLCNIARADHELQHETESRSDGEGGAVKIRLRNELPDDDIYSAIVHSDSLVLAMEQLLDGEVYHYHHKMILKEALEGAPGRGIRITATGTTTVVRFRYWPVV